MVFGNELGGRRDGLERAWGEAASRVTMLADGVIADNGMIAAAVTVVLAISIGCSLRPAKSLGDSVDDAVEAAQRARGPLPPGATGTIESASESAKAAYDDTLVEIPDEARDVGREAICAAIDLASGKSPDDIMRGLAEPYQVKLREGAAKIDAAILEARPYDAIARSAFLHYACAVPIR